MIKFQNLRNILLASALITVVSGQACIANEAQINLNQVVKTSSQIKTINSKHELKASYKLIGTSQKVAVVAINGKEVFRFDNTAGNASLEERAKVISNKLNAFIKSKENARTLRVGLYNGGAVAKYGHSILFSIDKETAEAQRMTGFALAHNWVNNVRVALGAPKLMNNDVVASRSIIPFSFSRTIFNTAGQVQQVGMASWYGGIFQGRRAADGSVFNTNHMTAAHKTLPFGTRVKVTNLKNGKECIVRISDRGPFVRGRIIDLSTAAAREIGMLSSGIGHVKIETLK